MSNGAEWIRQHPELASVIPVARKVVQPAKPPKAKRTMRVDLTDKFLGYWKLASEGLPQPVREHRFHETRRWRFDLAWLDQKLAVEFHGGVWIRGGHSRGKGQQRDFEKLNAAQAQGWTVLQFGTDAVSQREIANTLRTVREAIEIVQKLNDAD